MNWSVPLDKNSCGRCRRSGREGASAGTLREGEPGRFVLGHLEEETRCSRAFLSGLTA